MSSYWTQYWQQGHLTSFGEDVNGNYQGELAREWKTFFSSLPKTATSVLDIGTGNGALIDIALHSSQRDDIAYLGIDYARLNINRTLKKPNVTFFEKTDAALLPFDSESIDVVISQFGIEYSSLPKSLAQCVRVLKPDGILRFVMHCSTSTIVKPNKQILSALQVLASEDGSIHYLRQLINALAKYGKQSPNAEAARNALNLSLDNAVKHNKAGLYGTGFPEFLSAVMKPNLSFKAQKSMVKVFEKEMRGQVARLEDLVSAAQNDHDIIQLTSQLEALGMTSVISAPVYQDDQLIGVLIKGVKVGV